MNDFIPTGMRHADFFIGCAFLTGAGKWRCTDVGTRVIVAIRIDDHPDDPSWYNGPPYGAHVTRPELTKCLKALNADDMLVVWKLDRLGRSLRDLIGLLDDLKAQGVAFRSLTEAIDTATPTGRAMWQMLGSAPGKAGTVLKGASP